MNKNIWIACLILVTVDLIITVLDVLYLEQTFEFTYLNWSLGILGNILTIVVSVLMINVVQESPNKKSVIGFVWRGVIIYSLSLYVAAVLMVLFRIQFEIPSIQHTIAANLLRILAVVALSWILFSSNRKGQILWVRQLF